MFKEVRFGIRGSILFGVSTTGTSTGAVNSLHDSFTGGAGGIVLLNLLLGEVAPGVLELLVRHRGKLVGQRELLRAVWGPNYGSETNYLRVYLAQLRRMLEPEPSRHLITEAGMGYRFEV